MAGGGQSDTGTDGQSSQPAMPELKVQTERAAEVGRQVDEWLPAHYLLVEKHSFLRGTDGESY